MLYSIVIHHTYNQVIIALCNQDTIVTQKIISNKDISKLCIPTIDELLSNARYKLANLSFIATNTGPGPFSTVRSIIATVNGLHLAIRIPLISIDGLQTLFSEHNKHNKTKTVIALLNAYNNEVYFAFKHDGYHESGYANIDDLLKHFEQIYKDKKFLFVGNGSVLHEEKIVKIFNNNATITHDKQHASIEYVVMRAFAEWETEDIRLYLTAEYTKNYDNHT